MNVAELIAAYPDEITLSELIGLYGYLVVFLGGIFEGEITLILAGLAAHEGILELPFIFFWASLGAILGDALWFFVGRWYGDNILNQWGFFKNLIDEPQDFINRNNKVAAFFVRFMYGFRNFILFGLGRTEIQVRTFLFYSSLGAVLWAIIVGTLGYLFGNILETFLGNTEDFKLRLFLIVASVIIVALAGSRLLKLALKKFFK